MAKLRRVLGLFELTMIGVGIILGAGIYVLIGKAAGIAGNGVWISFFIAALVAAFTGLSYAELSSMFPKAGAEYEYVKESFGRDLGWFTGWFLIFAGVIATSTVSLGFAGYLNVIFDVPIIQSSIVLIIILSLINFWGIKQSATIAILFSIIETFGLLLVIFISVPFLGSVNYLEIKSFGSIFSAAALIFFAFIGFEEMSRLSEETKKSRKIMPKALIMAIIISTIIYILVSLSAISVINWEVLASSNSPLADVASKALGKDSSSILSFIALFSTFNTALLVLLGASRLVYGMANQKSLPQSLSIVDKKTKTPGPAIVISGILAIIFVFIGGIEIVGYLTDFLIFCAFIVINLSVIQLRYKKQKLERGFKIPFTIGKLPIIPLLGVVTSAFLLLSIRIEVLIYSVGLLMIGLATYVVRYKRFPFTKS